MPTSPPPPVTVTRLSPPEQYGARALGWGTVRRRRAGAVLLLTVVLAVAGCGGRPALFARPAPTPPPPVPSTTMAMTPVTGGPPPGAGAEAPAPPGRAAGAGLDPEAYAEAKGVAGAFGVAFTSYRYDEPASARVERVRPYCTPELVEELGQSSGAAYLRQQRASRREVGTAALVTVYSAEGGTTAERADLVVVVRVAISTSAGTSSRFTTVQVAVVRTPGGWRVARAGP